MADLASSKLNPDSHLILDQPLLRLPYELLRKNFKSAHLSVEKDSTAIRNSLKETANASLSHASSPDDVLRNLDSMIQRMGNLKRKLAACAEEETRLHRHSRARVRHLAELYAMQSLDDVKYEGWSRTRLDRLLVDYLLRTGYRESAEELARRKGIEELVDVETFVVMGKIRESLREGKVGEALAWCQENKKELRRMESNLEFMLRFQQYIELVRTQEPAKLLEAIAHAKKYLLPAKDSYPKEIQQAAGLLAFPPGTRASAYENLYSPTRWIVLGNLFQLTHSSLLSLPAVPLLHIALSAGLSALKTPSCHSSAAIGSANAGAGVGGLSSSSATAAAASSSSTFSAASFGGFGGGGGSGSTGASAPSASSAIGASVCPICSTELNELARNVPYAHHTKSHTAPDCVMLPNRRVYGRRELEEYSRKGGLGPDSVKDLRTGQVFGAGSLKKVYIS